MKIMYIDSMYKYIYIYILMRVIYNHSPYINITYESMHNIIYEVLRNTLIYMYYELVFMYCYC